MAYPTKITLTSGKTEYEGSEGGEGITSRQVRVSVTYQLERQDEDLLSVTERKAREVEAVQASVWRQVRKEQAELDLGSDLDLGTGPEDPAPPPLDEDCPDGDCPDDDDDPLAPYDANKDDDDDENEGAGSPFGEDDEPADRGAAGGANGTGANGTTMDGGGTGKRFLPVTKPQKLALSAQARRLGLSDIALAEIVKERFGKSSFTPRYVLDRLTKKEADALLRYLAEREWAAARTDHPVPA